MFLMLYMLFLQKNNILKSSSMRDMFCPVIIGRSEKMSFLDNEDR